MLKIKPADWCFKWPSCDDDGPEQPQKTPWVTDGASKSRSPRRGGSPRDAANERGDSDDDAPRGGSGC